jgi:hypothetical protein
MQTHPCRVDYSVVRCPPVFRKDYVKTHLPELNPDEVLSMFTPEDRLRGLALKDRLKGLAPKEIESYLKKLKIIRYTENRCLLDMYFEI